MLEEEHVALVYEHMAHFVWLEANWVSSNHSPIGEQLACGFEVERTLIHGFERFLFVLDGHFLYSLGLDGAKSFGIEVFVCHPLHDVAIEMIVFVNADTADEDLFQIVVEVVRDVSTECRDGSEENAKIHYYYWIQAQDVFHHIDGQVVPGP